MGYQQTHTKRVLKDILQLGGKLSPVEPQSCLKE